MLFCKKKVLLLLSFFVSLLPFCHIFLFLIPHIFLLFKKPRDRKVTLNSINTKKKGCEDRHFVNFYC